MHADRIDAIRSHFRAAQLSYVVALAILAALTIGTHVVIDTLVEKQTMAASLIGMSGRQRMLSEWIAKTALQVTVATDRKQYDETKEELQKLVALMRSSHEKLLAGLKEFDPGTPAGAALREVYYGAPYQLDRQVRNYISLSETMLKAGPGEIRPDDPTLVGIEDATKGPIIDALDEAVNRYQIINANTTNTLRLRLFGFMMLMLATIIAEALFIFRPLFRKLADSHDTLVAAACTDALTGCMNRGHFTTTANRELERCKRYLSPAAVLMVDIDHFKNINDNHGHDAGDQAIRSVVRIISEGIRAADFVGRMGGEEFAIILPETDLETALLVAEKLREKVARTPLETTNRRLRPVTVSVGAASVTDEDATIFDALKRADQALYTAKRNGRNRVVAEAMQRPCPLSA